MSRNGKNWLSLSFLWWYRPSKPCHSHPGPRPEQQKPSGQSLKAFLFSCGLLFHGKKEFRKAKHKHLAGRSMWSAQDEASYEGWGSGDHKKRWKRAQIRSFKCSSTPNTTGGMNLSVFLAVVPLHFRCTSAEDVRLNSGCMLGQGKKFWGQMEMLQEVKQVDLLPVKGTAFVHIYLLHCEFLFCLFSF